MFSVAKLNITPAGRFVIKPLVAGLVVLACGLYTALSIAAEYRIAHCLNGCPSGSAQSNKLLLRPIYALSYNNSTKSADWVAYKVTAGSIGIASSLSRTPRRDDYISDTLSPGDYVSEEGAAMLGAHYVALVDFAGTPYWDDVNFLSNWVARSRTLNQGAWYGLEWSVRNLVNRDNEVYILTGPVFREDSDTQQLATSKPHQVPDAFYKIVMTEDGRGSAFLFEQDTPVHVHHCDMRTTLEEIERLTSLDMFPLSEAQAIGALDEGLGCR